MRTDVRLSPCVIISSCCRPGLPRPTVSTDLVKIFTSFFVMGSTTSERDLLRFRGGIALSSDPWKTPSLDDSRKSLVWLVVQPRGKLQMWTDVWLSPRVINLSCCRPGLSRLTVSCTVCLRKICTIVFLVTPSTSEQDLLLLRLLVAFPKTSTMNGP